MISYLTANLALLACISPSPSCKSSEHFFHMEEENHAGHRTPPAPAIQHSDIATFSSDELDSRQERSFHGGAQCFAGRFLLCLFRAAADWDTDRGNAAYAGGNHRG